MSTTLWATPIPEQNYTKQKGNPGFKKRVMFFEIVPPEFQQKKHYAVIENCGVSTNSHSSWKVKMKWRQSTLHQNQSRDYRRGLRKLKDEECHECYRPYCISWLSMNVHKNKDEMNLYNWMNSAISSWPYDYAWLEFVTPSAWFQHFQNSGPQHPNSWWVVANWLLDGSRLQNGILSTWYAGGPETWLLLPMSTQLFSSLT